MCRGGSEICPRTEPADMVAAERCQAMKPCDGSVTWVKVPATPMLGLLQCFRTFLLIAGCRKFLELEWTWGEIDHRTVRYCGHFLQRTGYSLLFPIVGGSFLFVFFVKIPGMVGELCPLSKGSHSLQYGSVFAG